MEREMFSYRWHSGLPSSLSDCKANSSRGGGGGGSVSNFVENLRERWTGLWPHNGFSVLNFVENPERNDTGCHFSQVVIVLLSRYS